MCGGGAPDREFLGTWFLENQKYQAVFSDGLTGVGKARIVRKNAAPFNVKGRLKTAFQTAFYGFDP
ncbi:hypothetical protein HMPREF9123_1763 [Neisseria bacilliformis ATCC BAA-1200]|jgi:hypothetical protein|uniref:Uncharacterized protein n=1 Tax=Neisseria bacilliformis ATCC BAA-1200 TaxID=888742 RepID=F2BDF7_9NEIS|nr:hypothetical protein HMPREF9123_1763 [Neisseria bacilliformis ATCC BAA-1200]